MPCRMHVRTRVEGVLASNVRRGEMAGEMAGEAGSKVSVNDS